MPHRTCLPSRMGFFGGDFNTSLTLPELRPEPATALEKLPKSTSSLIIASVRRFNSLTETRHTFYNHQHGDVHGCEHIDCPNSANPLGLGTCQHRMREDWSVW